MGYDRFLVTFVDPDAGYGVVRQLTRSVDTPRFSFISFNPNGATRLVYDEHGQPVAYALAPADIKERVPEVGMVLIGAIAHNSSGIIELDAIDSPFLSNWGYDDQPAFLGDAHREEEDSGHDSDDGDLTVGLDEAIRTLTEVLGAVVVADISD